MKEQTPRCSLSTSPSACCRIYVEATKIYCYGLNTFLHMNGLPFPCLPVSSSSSVAIGPVNTKIPSAYLSNSVSLGLPASRLCDSGVPIWKVLRLDIPRVAGGLPDVAIVGTPPAGGGNEITGCRGRGILSSTSKASLPPSATVSHASIISRGR